MRKLIVMALLGILCLQVFSGDDISKCKSVLELFQTLNKSVDPSGKLAKAKTYKLIGRMIMPMHKMEISLTVLNKRPNKQKNISVFNNGLKMVTACDGTVVWQKSNSTGTRKVTGNERDFYIFAARMDNDPNGKDLFESIKFKGFENVAGSHCVNFELTPKKQFNVDPIFFSVDTKEIVVRRIKMTVVTGMGKIPFTCINTKFRDFDGVKYPCEQEIMLMAPMKMVLDNLIINPEIPDSEFAMPKLATRKKKK